MHIYLNYIFFIINFELLYLERFILSIRNNHIEVPFISYFGLHLNQVYNTLWCA